MKTLLIGLDGATFDVLDPLMKDGVMPFLQSFLAEGVRAPLRTVVPALTPPAWTSLMTGRNPGQHGVFDFFQMDPGPERHIRFFTSNDVGCDTIWTLASAAGHRVSSLNFPAMFPPPKIAGSVIPGWIPWRQLRLATWPEDLLDRLKTEVPGFNQKELAMDIKLEAKATEGVADRDEYLPWIDLHKRREAHWFDILEYVNRADSPDLVGVLFDGVDKLQHLCWRFLQPVEPLETEWEREIRDACLDYFRAMDDLIRKMCDLAGPDCLVMLASDHGFGPTHEVFHVNAWLERQGFLGWADRDPESQEDEDATLGVNRVARHTYLLDWDKTSAFAATPTSNGIYIVVNEDGKSPGVKPAEYESHRSRLIDLLKKVKDPETGEAVVQEVYTRDEIFDGPHRENAPDLTLVMRDHGLISILPSDTDVRKRDVIAGAHRPVGVFAAKGPGVRQGATAEELSILDVAPTTLYSLGIPAASGMQGEVAQSIFEPAWLEKNPIKSEAEESQGATAAEIQDAQISKDEEQILVERMRELGYIE